MPQPRSGNEAFFKLGVDLRSAGLSTAEIKDVLRLETGNARHPLSVAARSSVSLRSYISWRRMAA